MIGRKSKRESGEEPVEPKWFDDFDLRLGDMMRGERATMGKSLLDVQRELRIKAAYIAAIENADPSAFDTPGFIAGYVRSYARYLGMDPDWAFQAFCRESGFSTAHGMAAEASTIRKPQAALAGSGLGRTDLDPLSSSKIGFAPVGDSFLSWVEPRAVGSLLVVSALAVALGYGGWALVNEVQRVQMAPVERTPDVLAELDPLQAATRPLDDGTAAHPDSVRGERVAAGVFSPPSDALDRLYRPQALDVPVLVARDAPISTLDPASVGTFANVDVPAPETRLSEPTPTAQPQVIEEQPKGVVLFAVRAAWVRIKAADGTVIFQGTLDAGDEYAIPAGVEAPVLQAGMSGSLYFEVDGELYGPAGRGTATVRKLSVAREDLLQNFEPADFAQDPELGKVIAMAEAEAAGTAGE